MSFNTAVRYKSVGTGFDRQGADLFFCLSAMFVHSIFYIDLLNRTASAVVSLRSLDKSMVRDLLFSRSVAMV